MITRRMALALPLAVLLLLGFGLHLLEAQRTPPWRAMLDHYLHTTAPAMSVQQVQHATMPWLLAPAAYGQVVDYGRYCYQAASTVPEAPSCGLALPYPPGDVYCILLGNDDAKQLLLVSRFADNLWRDDWVIMTGPSTSSLSQAVQTVAAIGCVFEQPGTG